MHDRQCFFSTSQPQVYFWALDWLESAVGIHSAMRCARLFYGLRFFLIPELCFQAGVSIATGLMGAWVICFECRLRSISASSQVVTREVGPPNLKVET